MTTKTALLPLLALVAGLFATPVFRAGESPTGDLVAPTEQDAAWLTQARAAYPLKTCVVSTEELGGMGTPVEFIYRQAGQPDRLVRFCCKMCVPKFRKEPAKYLAQIAPHPKTEAAPPAPPAS